MYEIIINQAHGKGAERRWPGRRDAHLSTTAPASLIEQLPPPFLTPPPSISSVCSRQRVPAMPWPKKKLWVIGRLIAVWSYLGLLSFFFTLNCIVGILTSLSLVGVT